VAEETYKIKQHIDREREQLGRNLDEIEYRVKKATDFKTHFDNHTAWVLGAAVAGGFLLSLAVRASSPSPNTAGRKSESWGSSTDDRNRTERSIPLPLQRISGTLDNIFEGLACVVGNKLQSFVADKVPGFREQYDAVEREHGRSTSRQSDFSAVR